MKNGEGDGSFQIPWPADLVARYQTKFFKDSDMVLNRAWQDIPYGAIALMLDTIRTRVLDFALELKGQVSEEDTALSTLPRQKVDAAVTNNFFGGNNILSSSVSGGLTQIGSITVNQGDLGSLTKALQEVGITPEGVTALTA